MSEDIWRHPITQELLSQIPTQPNIRTPFTFTIPIAKQWQDEERFIVAGYASVEVIDSQNELIPIEALKKAWERFSSNPQFMNCSLMHSNISVGKVIPDYTDSEGTTWKSGVDEQGLFIVTEVRKDIKKGAETRELITAGKLKGFSIGGEALASSMVCEGKCYTRIDKLELHEISYVDRPANAPSVFTILKADKLVKLATLAKNLPHFIISPGVAKLVGSTAELGEGHDFDILISAKKGSFIDRAVQTRIYNHLRKIGKLDLWDHVQIIHEPEGLGPYTDHQDLYDLVLLRSSDQVRSMDVSDLLADGGVGLVDVNDALTNINKGIKKMANDKKPEEEEEKKKGDVIINAETKEPEEDDEKKKAELSQFELELSAKVDKLIDLIARAEESGDLEKMLFTKPCPQKYPKPKDDEDKKAEKPDEEEEEKKAVEDEEEEEKKQEKKPEKYPYEKKVEDEEEEEEKKQDEKPEEEEEDKLKNMVASAISNAFETYGITKARKRTKVPDPAKAGAVDLSMEKLFKTPWNQLHKIAKNYGG